MCDMYLSPTTFHRLGGAIQELCGIVISEDKAYLVHDRLEPVIRQRGLSGFDELQERLASQSDPALADAVIDAVTTQETSFFRDANVFEALATVVLPTIIRQPANPQRGARILVAGTATGQEAYSLAMLAHEYLVASGQPPHAISILAADISSTAIQIAKEGVYDARELARGVSPSRRHRHFQEQAGKFRICDAVRRLVEFRRLNLTKPMWGLGPFDLISCRNVLIYLDAPTRRQFCDQCHSLLADHGWFLLGTAENLYGVSEAFVSMPLGNDALIYRKA